MSAPISEIFCSVQGEGPYVGFRQAFVRFVGCNLKCPYCDTDQLDSQYCSFERDPGSGIFENVPNPLTAKKVEEMVSTFKDIHSVSLTGGEPLMHADFIAGLNLSAPLYLESNMTLPDMAKKVRDKVSYVAGDVKFIGGFEGDDFESHIDRTIECFKVLRNTDERECFCKIVVTEDMDLDTVTTVVDSISDYISCVILQPVTRKQKTDNVKVLLELQQKLLADIDTRIIPQTHKMWGCL